MHILNFMRCSVVVLMLSPVPASAQSFDTGETAYREGDYAAALLEWLPLANQGNARAQNALGVVHQLGQGVQQDHAG